MTFNKNFLPDPSDYYTSQNLRLQGSPHATWKTTQCVFHGGSDSMRVNVKNGAFKCMNCGVGGGDVLAYHCLAHQKDFVESAKDLNAWREDGRYEKQLKPSALRPKDALEVLVYEAMIVAVAAGNLAKGLALTDDDRARLMVCAGRICRIAGDFS